MMLTRRSLMACVASLVATARSRGSSAGTRAIPVYSFSQGPRPGQPGHGPTRASLTAECPLPDAFAGVCVTIPWAVVAPTPTRFDFSLLDAALDYWGRRGKRVNVNIPTIGYPLDWPDGPGTDTCTPPWVMRQTPSYRIAAHDQRFNWATTDADYPDFRHPGFQANVAHLVGRLAAYDGNPAVAMLRIATGVQGEDNPIAGPLVKPLPWYTEAQWLDYCGRVTGFYTAAFRRTQLEFDLGRCSVAVFRDPALRPAYTRLLNQLRTARVMLCHDGLSSSSAAQIADPNNQGGAPLRDLQAYAAQGGLIGLEMVGPFYNKSMHDAASIVAAVRMLQPARVNVFGDMAMALVDPSRVPPRVRAETIAEARALMAGFGYG